jgi:tungstate transport system substrate-binding protein
MIDRRAAALAAALLLGTVACADGGRSELILATTTSVQDAGLLDSLLPPFERSQRVRVKIIAVGTGAALEMARRRDADVVIGHAPELERRYADAGHLVGGRLLMRNDFVLVGPPGDSAGAAAAGSLEDAMRAIAARGRFVSRGDGSGTEERELELWRAAGVDPETLQTRVETGQGQGATLLVASERRAYTLTDRATLTVLAPRLALAIVAGNDPRLANEYRAHVVPVAGERTRALAQAFVEYLTSAEAQALIGRFGMARYGRQLFAPASGG